LLQTGELLMACFARFYLIRPQQNLGVRRTTEIANHQPFCMARSKEQVEWELAGILRRIANRSAGPRVGLGELVAAHRKLPEPGGGGFVGEEYGIAELIGCYWGYDDLEERPTEVSVAGQFGAKAIAALDAEVIRLAQQWLDERGA
jgi:hypothetical protein